MTNRFLSTAETGTLEGGTTTIFGATIGAENLLASTALKTNALKVMVSTNLDISDVNSLQTQLDSVGVGWSRTAPLVAFTNAGDRLAVTTYQSADGIVDMVMQDTVDHQNNLKTDQISESTGAANITMNQKTIHVGNLDTNIINERTVGAGVTIDGFVMKDLDISKSTNQLRFRADGVLSYSSLTGGWFEIRPNANGEGFFLIGRTALTDFAFLQFCTNNVAFWNFGLGESGVNNFNITNSTNSDIVIRGIYSATPGVSTVTFPGDCATDVINEITAGVGVTVDGVLLKDSKVTATGIQDSTLTASKLVETDGSKNLVSVTDLTGHFSGGTQVSITGTDPLTINSDNTQNMNTGDSPSFTGLTVSGLTASKLVETNGSSALASVTDLTGHFTGGTQITITGTDPLTFNSDNTQNLNTGDSPTFAGVTTSSITSTGNLTLDTVLSGEVNIKHSGTEYATFDGNNLDLKVNTINEFSVASGITLDGVLLKDNEITLGLGTNVGEFSIDGLLAGDSDDAVPTEKAVKEYIDSFVTVFNNASEGNSSTTGLSLVQKVKLTFTALASDYLISWSAEVNSTDSGTRVNVVVEQDDTTTLSDTDWNPDGNAGTGYGPHSGFAIVTLTAASHDFDIDFASTQSGKSVQIRRARITAKRML